MERSSRRGRDDDRDDDRGSRRGRDDDDRGSRRGRDDDDDRRGSRRSGGYQYRQRDSASAKKRAEGSGKDYDRYLKDVVDGYQVADGDNIVRILPPTWDDAEHYGHDLYVHYEIGPDKGTYLCLQKMKGEPCPICEERKRAVADGDEDYAKKLEPKKRVLAYVIDRKKEKEGLKVWAMPWTLDRDIVKVSVDRRSGEVMTIDHPEDGYDVMFERHGKGNRTEYTGVSIDRRPSPLDNDKAMGIAVDNPLPTLLQFYSYDHISSVFGGGSPAPSSDRGGSGRGHDRERDDDRGGSRGGRSGMGRDDADRDSDVRDSGRDRGSSSRDSGSDHTWESIHEMKYDELCDLIDDHKLDIDPDKSKDDEDLADWICEEMKIKKEERRSESRGRSRDDDGDDGRSSARRRLDSMRGGRD